MSATALMPNVEMECDDIAFGPVTVGGAARKRVSLRNKSPIATMVLVDLTQHPQFTLAMPMAPESGSVSGESLFSVESAARVEDLSGTGAGKRRGGGGGDSDEEGEGEEPKLPTRFKLRIPPDSALPFDLVFSPTTVRVHNFNFPVSLMGVPTPESLTRLVTAEGVAPRLQLASPTVEFAMCVVHSDPSRRTPYRKTLEFTSLDEKPLEWRIDDYFLSVNKAAGPPIFSLSPNSGRLEPGQLQKVEVTFQPVSLTNYHYVVPMYLDGQEEAPYMEINLKGKGIEPQLTFEQREVVLPSVPLNFSTSAVFYVLNQGYDHLELRYRLPAEGSDASIPLQVIFPEGTTIGLAKKRLPVKVVLTSKKPLAFTVPLEFLDDEGQSYSIPISGITENSLLSNYQYVEGHREDLALLCRPGKSAQLMTKEDIERVEKARAEAKKRRRSVSKGAGAKAA
ncbi:CFAP47, partial [Symbiodinium sp. KB8]